MNQQNSTNRFNPSLEKIIIALLFSSIIVFYLYTGQRDLKEGKFFSFVLLLESVLLVYYIYLTRNFYSIFLIGYVVLNIGYYEQTINFNLGDKIVLAGELSQFCLGLFLGYKTFLESKANKDWEMFGTLITLALLFPLIYRFALSGKEIVMVYHFALAFMLATIIYNENLWDKYNSSEKKILTYILVSTVVEVLFISVNLL
jgi:hypothetical protein